MNGRMAVSLLAVLSVHGLPLNASVLPCMWETTRELRVYGVMKTLVMILGLKARAQGQEDVKALTGAHERNGGSVCEKVRQVPLLPDPGGGSRDRPR